MARDLPTQPHKKKIIQKHVIPYEVSSNFFDVLLQVMRSCAVTIRSECFMILDPVSGSKGKR